MEQADNEYRIPLTRGLYAIVDREDYEALQGFRWCAAQRGRFSYAQRYLPKPYKVRFLHLDVLCGSGEAKPNRMKIVWRDGNRLNCKRDNLVLLPISKAMLLTYKAYDHNSTGYSGVYWRARWNRATNEDCDTYDFVIQVRGHRITRRGFSEAKAAAAARVQMLADLGLVV